MHASGCTLDSLYPIDTLGNLRQLLTPGAPICNSTAGKDRRDDTGPSGTNRVWVKPATATKNTLPITSSNFRQRCWKKSLIKLESGKDGVKKGICLKATRSRHHKLLDDLAG